MCEGHHKNNGEKKVGEGERVVVGNVDVVSGVVVEGVCSCEGGCCCESSQRLAWFLDGIHLLSLLPLQRCFLLGRLKVGVTGEFHLMAPKAVSK